MFVRVLFFVLLLASVGLAIRIHDSPSAAQAQLPVTDADVPKLVLLSEKERPPGASPNASSAAAEPDPTAAHADDVCVSLGAFATRSDMRAAVNALTPHVAHIQYREASVSQVRGYWVFLPAPSSRERALAIARQLTDLGVRDFYITTAGEQPNAISLGLFRDPGNAQKRLNEIQSLGFKPEMIQRSDEVPVYYVDYAQAGKEPLDWRALLPPSEVQATTIECF